MKKALLIALALIVMIAPACNTSSTINSNNGNSNSAHSSNGNSNTGPQTSSAPTSITMVYKVSKTTNDGVWVQEDCKECTTPIPTVSIAGTPKVTWHVEFDASIKDPTLSIEKFQKVELASSGSGLTYTPDDPFGTHPDFKFDPSTNPADKAGAPGKKGTYKYNVVVTWTDNSMTNKVTLDPRIMIDP